MPLLKSRLASSVPTLVNGSTATDASMALSAVGASGDLSFHG